MKHLNPGLVRFGNYWQLGVLTGAPCKRKEVWSMAVLTRTYAGIGAAVGEKDRRNRLAPLFPTLTSGTPTNDNFREFLLHVESMPGSEPSSTARSSAHHMKLDMLPSEKLVPTRDDANISKSDTLD